MRCLNRDQIFQALSNSKAYDFCFDNLKYKKEIYHIKLSYDRNLILLCRHKFSHCCSYNKCVAISRNANWTLKIVKNDDLM